MNSVTVCAHTFLISEINEHGVVLDCGANHGDFSYWIVTNANVKVHGFEPDPRLFAALQSSPMVRFHEMALAPQTGRVELNLGSTASSCSSIRFMDARSDSARVNVAAMSIVDFCESNNITRIELLKMDIEGAEIEILSSIPESALSKIKQITVEFHDFLDRRDIPAIKAIFERLNNLGFDCIKISQFAYTDVLFVNRKMIRMSLVDKVLLYISRKYVPGLRRILSRALVRSK